MSGPKGHIPKPDGNWSVIGFIDGDAMIAKESTIVRVPIRDLQVITSLDINDVVDKLSNTGLNKINKIDVSLAIADVFHISVEQVRQLLISNNYSLEVASKAEVTQIIERLQRAKNGQSRKGKIS